MSQPFKLTLFALFSVFCFLIGWGNFVWHDETVITWIRYGGYYFILLSTIAWAWALLRAYPATTQKATYRRLFSRANALPLVLIFGLWGLIQLGEDKSFKILLDEPVLVNTSRMMHYNREVLVVSNAARVDGILAAKGYVDKRPNFFPFLVSVLHDVTGYRVANAYVLNSILTLALLGLMYVVCSQLSGRAGGLLGVGLLGSLPLVWHQSSGAGFEILNLVMILLTLKVAIDYFQKPSDRRLLSALCLTVAMLSQVRYESVLFVIPVAMLVLMGMSLTKRVNLPWGAWLAPLLLVPVLWQQRVFNVDPSFWELFTVGTKTPFSFDYYTENLAQSVYFFFAWIRQMPGAPLVSYIGWIATLIFVVCMCLRLVSAQRRQEVLEDERSTFVFWIFLVGFALYFVLLMCYAFDLGRYMVQRLSLPLYLLISLAAALVWAGWVNSRRPWALWWRRGLFTVVFLGFVGWTLPSVHSRDYAAIYFPMVEGRFVEQFVNEHRHERYLVVADMSMLWTTYEVEAIPNRAVNAQLREIKYFLEQPNNPPVYVMQSLEYDPAERRFRDMASDPLTPVAVLQPVKNYHIGSFRILRISRLMDLTGVEPIDDSELYHGDENKKLQDWVSQLP